MKSPLTISLLSLLSLSPLSSLAHADYWQPAQSHIERLPHFAQQHFDPNAPQATTQSPESETPHLPEATLHSTHNDAQTTEQHNTPQEMTLDVTEKTVASETPQIYGYGADGLPITDFSIKVNAFRDAYRQNNPHLFVTKSSEIQP
jgi:hypothetical protein